MRALLIAFLWSAPGLTTLALDLDFVQLDVPGAVLTRPFGANARGAIVGLYRDGLGNHGFVRSPDGTYETIDVPGAIFTNASSTNARGDVVGRWTDGSGHHHAYLRRANGQLIRFDPPSPCVVSSGGNQTVPHGIDDAGDIVGRCFDSGGKELGWLWSHDGTFTILDDPAFQTTDAWMVTNEGVVVGDYSDASGFVHGYVWTSSGGFVTLDFPGDQTGLRAMNARGDVTGIYSSTGPGARTHGFLLRDGVFTTVDYPDSADGGGTLIISDPGLFVGGFFDAGGEHGFMATTCPASGCP